MGLFDITRAAGVPHNSHVGHTSDMNSFYEKMGKEAERHNRRFVSANETRAVLGIESMVNHQASLQSAESEFIATLKRIGSEVLGTEAFGKHHSRAREEAAVYAAMVASNPAEILNRGNLSVESAKAMAAATGGEFIQLGGDYVSDLKVSREAFDNRVNDTIVNRAITYAYMAPRQNAFAEMFFPSVTIAPNQAAFSTSIDVQYVFEPVKHAINGQAADFKRVVLLKALRSPDVLRNTATKVIPVYRAGGGASDSTRYFADPADVPTRDVKYENEKVTTTALKFGTSDGSLIALGQTDALIANGVFTHTDALDSALRFENLYLKLPAGLGAKTLMYPIRHMRGANFVNAQQGNSRSMTINNRILDLVLKKGMLDTHNAALAALDTLLGDKVVRFSLSLTGQVNLQSGNYETSAGPIRIDRIIDATGASLDVSDPSYVAIASALNGSSMLYFDIWSRRTNSNLRENGQRIDTQRETNVYYVPTGMPVTAQRPVGESDASDQVAMSSLTQLCYTQASNEAVDRLFEISDYLELYTSDVDTVSTQPQLLGVSSHVLTATHINHVIDLETQVDSIKSADRAEDTLMTVLNSIRDVVYRLWTESGLQLALEAAYNGSMPKPVVLIGCAPLYKRWLTDFGDPRVMGDFFSHRIEDSWNEKMEGYMFISFGLEEAFSSGQQCPWHFGNFANSPEVPVVMPITRGSATTMEMILTPRWLHVGNLPVMAKVQLKGIEKIIATKNAILTKAVTP